MQGTQSDKDTVTVLIERDIIRCALSYAHQSYLRCKQLKVVTGD